MKQRGGSAAFAGGAGVGVLGGLIGLGGAEFRLPLLIGVYGFGALPAVIVNKAMSLIVVASSLPFRTSAVPIEQVIAAWPIILNLLAGSLLGAWCGADWATKLKSQTLFRTIAALLVVMAIILSVGHGDHGGGTALFTGVPQIVAGVAAGFVIGVVASLMGVAGGELLIPTLILLFGADVKLAGSLSLAISLPTMLVGFARYSRDGSFSVLRHNMSFVLAMVAGSILGAYIGSVLLHVIDESILLPVLACILIISAVKVWRHE